MGVSTAPEQHRRGRRCRWEPLDVEAVAPAASVAVMAPALTEGGPQKPDDLLTPLPASGFLSPEQAAQVCQGGREVLAKFVVSANVEPSKIDEQCLRGISKELLRDVINSKYSNGFDSLSMFANEPEEDLITLKNHNNDKDDDDEDQTKILDYEEEPLEEEEGQEQEQEEEEEEERGDEEVRKAEVEKRPVMPDSKDPEPSDIIMSDPCTNSQNDEMGFLKASDDIPMVGVSGLPTDKDLARIMDFNNELSTNVGDDIVGNVVDSDIGQNVEDILQVIKSIEGGETAMETGDTIIPSGSTESGVNSGVEMFPMSETFSSFERDYLNDVDVMSLVNDNINMNINMNESLEAQRDNNLRIQQETVEQKQFEVERRCAFLLRRLRKLQARIIGRHIAEENTGVLELAHHSVKKYFLQELSSITPKGTNPKNFPEIGGTLNAFLQKIEKSCVAQSNSVNRQRVCCRYFGGGSRDNALSGGNTSGGSNVTRHPLFGTAQVKVDGDEVENVAGSLATQLHTVESNLDSECTASSSGGESCDEMQTFNNPHQQQLPISKRAAWRYAQDRAGVATRWTWLQAQIWDVEYRIRQHNDLQREVRTNKGLVHLVDNSVTVNGYVGGTAQTTASAQPSGACRTRAFAWETYRKRKLLRVDGLHEESKRAARPSTVRCDCDHVLAPCALCTGRLDPTQPHEPLDQLSIPERIARVDPCYHPVLSFPDETTHNTHFDAIMKSSDWQQKVLRGSVRMSRIKDKQQEPIERRKQQNKIQSDHPKSPKYTTKIKKSSSSLLTARIKRKMLKGKRIVVNTGKNVQSVSKKRVNKVSQQTEDDEDVSAQSSSSKHSSPVPSPLQQPSTPAEKIPTKEKSSNSHTRLRQNSYDIDNIVIPYSVAAATRLEKLQYKEILTPKWRLLEELGKVEIKNGVMHRPSQDSDVEDVSDEAVALRHERSEREEYKRFMTYVNMVPQSRIRHSRRADSRADSGANTPDPMSPHPSELGGDVTSPITSPPATPMSQDTQDQHNTLDNNHRNSIHYAIRRRTISSNKIKEETNNSVAEEEKNEILPYQARTFPLSEEVYDKMLEVMPDGYWQSTASALCSRVADKVPEEEAELDSPESDTTESAYCDADGEDPNDPEWTVGDERDTEKESIRLTAKR